MEHTAAQRRTATKTRKLEKAASAADFLFKILSMFCISQLAAARAGFKDWDVGMEWGVARAGAGMV
jgi:hypothetical protein